MTTNRSHPQTAPAPADAAPDAHDVTHPGQAGHEAPVSSAVELLRQHNAWRRGADLTPTDPTALGQAIDAVIAALSAPQPTSGGEVVERVAIALHRAYNTMLVAADFVDGWPGWQGATPEEREFFLRHAREAVTAPPSAPVGVEGFEQWYARVDARFWNNWDACNAAFHAGKNSASLAQQPSAAPVGVEAMAAIGHLIATQDNRITASPIFIVQQKRLYAADPECDYDRLVWVDGDGEAGAEDAARLDAEYAETGIEPAGWRRAAEAHYWDFVTACFTEQGCKDYIARDGHNLREPRIYAAGSYRNTEWQAVRSYLIALAAQPGGDHG